MSPREGNQLMGASLGALEQTPQQSHGYEGVQERFVRALEDLGYEVSSIRYLLSTFAIQLSCKGMLVEARLYTADDAFPMRVDFMTRLEFLGDVLQSQAAHSIERVVLDSQATALRFELSDGGTIHLDETQLSVSAFATAHMAYQALGGYRSDDLMNWPENRIPIFMNDMVVDCEGKITAAYWNPAQADLPYVAIADAGGSSTELVRRTFQSQVMTQILAAQHS